MQTIELKTGGMHCSSCSMLIQMSVDELPGIETVDANYGTARTRVTFDSALVSAEQVMSAIRDAGYSAELA
jgi:copper chaperone CopZ